jgi:hypothetical protein
MYMKPMVFFPAQMREDQLPGKIELQPTRHIESAWCAALACARRPPSPSILPANLRCRVSDEKRMV